jgi:hypothetical protein
MFLNSNIKLKITVVLLLLAASTLLIVNTRSRFASASRNGGEPAAPESQQSRDRIESELITVRPSGFDPVELTRPAGHFNLRVNNRSGVPELQFHLLREKGERLRDMQLERGRLAWNQFLELPPGRYILTEASHPDWVCTITITPR